MNLIIAFILSIVAVSSYAQSSTVDRVHQIRKDLYCTASSGDGWADVTFSKSPGWTKRYIGMTGPAFKEKDRYFTLEYSYWMQQKRHLWSADVKNRQMFASISEQEMRRCFRELKYDEYFDYLEKKPSELFSKRTTKTS